MTRKGIGIVIVAGVAGIVLGLALATVTDVESLWQRGDVAINGPQPNQGANMPEWRDYEGKIQRPLFNLATSQEPDAVADEHQLETSRMVRVVIRLSDGASELPSGYTVVVEAEGAAGIQAWVPLDQLLDLAQEASIGYIRPPQEPSLH